jgi:hypothetical protein
LTPFWQTDSRSYPQLATAAQVSAAAYFPREIGGSAKPLQKNVRKKAEIFWKFRLFSKTEPLVVVDEGKRQNKFPDASCQKTQ